MNQLLKCQFCGSHFQVYRSDAKYCGPKCRKAASRYKSNINKDSSAHLRHQRDYDMFTKLMTLSMDDKTRLSEVYNSTFKHQNQDEYRKYQTDSLKRLKKVCSMILEYSSGDMVERSVMNMFFQELVALSERFRNTDLSEGIEKIRMTIDICLYPEKKDYYWSPVLDYTDAWDCLQEYSQLDPVKHEF